MASILENIQGHTLEVRVHGGTKLKNTVKVGKQDPFVELIYGESNYKTKPCKGGGTSPIFNDKFFIELVQGLPGIKILVHSRNSMTKDDFIGEGTVLLNGVLQNGYHDVTCLIFNDTWSAGEISLTMIYPNAQFSYQHMREAKEKAERDLISYQCSTPELEQYTRSELELENMKIKYSEMEKKLTTLKSGHSKGDKLKQIPCNDAMDTYPCDKLNQVQLIELDKLQAKLATKDAELAAKDAKLAAKDVNLRKLGRRLKKASKLLNIKDAEVENLNEKIEAACMSTSNDEIRRLAQEGLITQRNKLMDDVEKAHKERDNFAKIAKDATERAETLDLALQQSQRKKKEQLKPSGKDLVSPRAQHQLLLAALDLNPNQEPNKLRFKSKLKDNKEKLRALQKKHDDSKSTKVDLELALEEKEKVKQQQVAAICGLMNMMKRIESSIGVSEELKAKMKESITQLQCMSENIGESSSYSDVDVNSSVLSSDDDKFDGDSELSALLSDDDDYFY